MSPIRILIIAALLYIAYRLIFGDKKASKSEPAGISDEGYSNQQAVEDVLVEDPVCHSLVPKKQAVRLEHEHEEFYFCSEECCRQFVEEKRRKK